MTDITTQVLDYAQHNRGPLLLMGPLEPARHLAGEVSRLWADEPDDVIHVNQFYADDVRRVRTMAMHRADRRRVFILQMWTNQESQTALLKILEDARPNDRFILVSAWGLLPTLESRCHVFQLPALSADDVNRLLLSRNFHPDRAKALAQLSGGSVDAALREANDPSARVAVLAAYRAVGSGDVESLELLTETWTAVHTDLMTRLCTESLSGRWRAFSEDAVEGLDRDLSLRILRSLAVGARPRLVVRSLLRSVAGGEE